MILVRKIGFLYFLGLLWLGVPSAGQSPGEKESFTFKFTVFGLHPGNYEGIHYFAPDGDPEELNFRKRQRSLTYSCEVELPVEPLRFFRIQSSPEGPIFETVAQITPSPGWSEMLFLFTEPQQKQDSFPLTVFAADDDEKDFPFGTIRVLNLTGIPLGGSIDGRSEYIKPKDWTDAFRIKRAGEVDILFAAATSESLHLVYRKTMPLWENSRTLLILRPPSRRGSIRIGATTLQDFEPEE